MTNQKSFRFIIILALCLVTLTVAAQTKRRRTVKNPPPPPTPSATVEPEAAPTPPLNSGKKNSRPNAEIQSVENTVQPNKTNQNFNFTPVYFFEFSQPEFANSRVVLEYDENGKGKITLRKKDLEEDFTDPIQLSPATLEKLNELWAKLNFLDANENYQSKKYDYPHLGTMHFKIKKDGREREVVFNFTEHPDAKALADEYKKISYQFVWMFDMSVARENMPLDAPRVMQQLYGYLKRDEISDPPSLIPYLRQLSNDERIPLIARNSATRMIADIEKKAAKK